MITPRREAGRLGSRLRLVLLAVVVLAVAVAAPLVAQAPAQVPVLDGIAAHYRDAARLWRPRLLPITQQLFMMLASLEFAVSGAIWALRRDSLDDIAAHSIDVFFSFDTMVHIEPRDIFNYLTRIPRLMRGRRLCILYHANMLTERGWARFLGEWDKNLMGRRGTAFSVMTDGIMQRFLDHLGYEVIEKDIASIPRDCVWILRAPAESTGS